MKILYYLFFIAMLGFFIYQSIALHRHIKRGEKMMDGIEAEKRAIRERHIKENE